MTLSRVMTGCGSTVICSRMSMVLRTDRWRSDVSRPRRAVGLRGRSMIFTCFCGTRSTSPGRPAEGAPRTHVRVTREQCRQRPYTRVPIQPGAAAQSSPPVHGGLSSDRLVRRNCLCRRVVGARDTACSHVPRTTAAARKGPTMTNPVTIWRSGLLREATTTGSEQPRSRTLDQSAATGSDDQAIASASQARAGIRTIASEMVIIRGKLGWF